MPVWWTYSVYRHISSQRPDSHWCCSRPYHSMSLNPFTAMLAAPSIGKIINKSAKFETVKTFLSPSHETRQSISMKMHSIETRFVAWPSNVRSGGVYVCTFQPGNFTGWGSEGLTENDQQLPTWFCYAFPFQSHVVDPGLFQVCCRRVHVPAHTVHTAHIVYTGDFRRHWGVRDVLLRVCGVCRDEIPLYRLTRNWTFSLLFFAKSAEWFTYTL